MHFNIHGKCTGKLHKIQLLLSEHNIKVLCVCETWCGHEIMDFSLGDYRVVNFYCRQTSRRGGVCIIVHKDLNLTDKIDFGAVCEEKNFEMCGIKVHSNDGFDVIVCAVYRTPDADFGVFMNKLDRVMDRLYKPGNKIVICGDVNVNMRDDQFDRNAKNLIDFFSEYNMVPVFSSATRICRTKQSCIDNTFTNCDVDSSSIFDSDMSDHTYQVVGLSNMNVIPCAKEREYRVISRGNIQFFRQQIEITDWRLLMDEAEDVESLYNEFHNKVQEIFNAAFPFRRKTTSKQNNNQTWITNELRELSKLVKEMANICRDTNSEFYKSRYITLKRLYDGKVLHDKKTFNDRRLTNASNINKECWNIINENRKGMTSGVKDIKGSNGTVIENTMAKCNAFNEHFLNISCNISTATANVNGSGTIEQRSFYLHPTSADEVSSIITKVCKKRSFGADDLPGNIIQEIRHAISQPLSEIINRSFAEGTYPSLLKESRVIPIYKKKGDPTEMNNYRPVALQSNFAKVFEYCFNIRLAAYLEKYNLLSESQNGFRANYSTLTALDRAMDHIFDALENKKMLLGLFFDFSSAFNTVHHGLLLDKMYNIGVRGPPLEWLQSYLHQRTQRVDIDGVKSAKMLADTGTPQGSCLSPTLFNVFINDLPDALQKYGIPVMYADDTNVLIPAKSADELFKRSNDCVESMLSWSRSNGAMLNPTKTHTVQFHVKNKIVDSSLLIRAEGTSIENMTSTTFLGMHIDHKLTWTEHIENLLTRMSSSCFLIRNIRDTVSMGVLKLLYYGLIQSIISYGIVFWGNAADAARVFVAQKRIVRCMLGLPLVSSCRTAFGELGIMTVPSLYIYGLIIYTSQRHFVERRAHVHDHDTRCKEELCLPLCRLSITQSGPKYIGVKCYNKLMSLKNLSALNNSAKFKHELKTFLIDRCYYTMAEFWGDDRIV